MGIWFPLILVGFAAGLAAVEYRPFLIWSHYTRVGSVPKTALGLSTVGSFEFADLIVIDSSCGRKQDKCQRFCTDTDFTALYCEYRCHAMAPQMAMFICNDDSPNYRYNGSGGGGEPLAKWQWQVSGWRTMYGREYSEEIHLHGFPVWHDLAAQIRIVSAASFDRRALGDSNDAVFGLGPGARSPLYQIAKARRLQPVMTMAGNYWAVRAITKWYGVALTTTVGHLDMSRCAGWEFVKSLSADRWVFPIEGVDYMGVKFGKAMGTFSYALSQFASVSTQIADRLIAEGVAELAGQNPQYQDYFKATVPCDTERRVLPPVTVRIGNIELFFNESATYSGLLYRNGQSGCIHNLIVDYKSPHQNAEVWIFGRALFREYCVAFDFEKLTIGFAKLRKWPFPFLQRGRTAI